MMRRRRPKKLKPVSHHELLSFFLYEAVFTSFLPPFCGFPLSLSFFAVFLSSLFVLDAQKKMLLPFLHRLCVFYVLLDRSASAFS